MFINKTFKSKNNNKISLNIFNNKGGVFTINNYSKNLSSNNYGWIFLRNKKKYTNFHFSRRWKTKIDNNSIEIKGSLFQKYELESSPLRHFILRLFSFLNINLFPFLRKIMIFKNGVKDVIFTRKIKFDEYQIVIHDQFLGNIKNCEIKKNRGFDVRHTASGSNFEIQNSIKFHSDTKIISNNENEINAKTTYFLNE